MPRVAAFAPGALFSRAPLAGLALLAACSAAPAPAPAPTTRALAPPSRPTAPASARFFHALPEAGFWVTHDDALDRLVVEGARLEVAPSGQLLRAAWDEDLAERGDELVGSIAAPASQGGGFVHWSRKQLFRSRDFTGPCTPIAAAGAGVRGVRPGLAGLLVAITDDGPRAITAGGARLGPFAAPGVLDVLAASPTRAIQLDVFGRATVTFDGGRAWQGLASSAGIMARSIHAEGGALGVETWRGRFLVGPGGALTPTEPSGSRASAQPFQTLWSGTRADRDDASFGYRALSPFQAAVVAGATIGDGTAFGVADNAIVRVDLAAGKTVSLFEGGVASGLECEPLRSVDEVLFACAWDRYQGLGGYVLRSRGGALPVVERAFTDAGYFVADDDGALAYQGSCAATRQSFDPEAADGPETSAPQNKPILCVRRAPERGGGPAEWVERTVEIDPPGTLAAWIPRRDGTATALVLSGRALPDPLSAPITRTQGGVRVIRVDRPAAGWTWARPTLSQRGRSLASHVIDKRFRARDDGTIDAWLTPAEEGLLDAWRSVTLAPDGTLASHPPPPALGSMQVTGDFGAAIAQRGELFETTDHGRSWRAAGSSPLPPSAVTSGGCSALGCVLGPLVRLGWGADAGLTVSVRGELAPPPPAPTSLPRLACAPFGAPIPVAPPKPPLASSRQTIPTPWGDTLEVAREGTASRPAPPKRGGAVVAAPKPQRRSALAAERTHWLIVRPPLAPFAVETRLDVTAPELTTTRGARVTPLLGPGGEVALLVGGETTELLIAGDHVTAAPSFEPRRFGGHDDGLGAGGLTIGVDRALVLGEARRRLTFEDHRVPRPPPLFLGVEREPSRRRGMTLGARDDGATGVLVFDGAAPDVVGVAPLDPAGAGVLALGRLASWSTVTLASDPRCQAPDPTAYRALIVLDPTLWLALDPRALPGVTLGHQGLAEVRWGRDRVCLAAVDAAVIDLQRRGDGARAPRLIARWDGKRAAATAPNGALRAPDLRQDLRCALAPSEASR